MEAFSKYLAGIDDPDHRERTEKMMEWVARTFPQLEPQLKWNTPMFTDHGTFIIAIDTAKHHVSVSPEEAGMTRFGDDIRQAGYSATKGLFRIPWGHQIDYELLKKVIEFNIQDKADCTTFWRK